MMSRVYLMFGPQGAGKTTQGERLAKFLEVPYLDAGAALREFVARPTAESRAVQATMQAGRLVANSTLKQIFDDFLTRHQVAGSFVTDGFPRNMSQVELFEQLATEHHWQVTGVYIKVSDSTSKERLGKRFTLVDGQEVRRRDDQPEIVEKRLQTFGQETLPVINWLKGRDELVEIDGEPDQETVYQAMLTALKLLPND